jgi:hypothetical protein
LYCTHGLHLAIFCSERSQRLFDISLDIRREYLMRLRDRFGSSNELLPWCRKNPVIACKFGSPATIPEYSHPNSE